MRSIWIIQLLLRTLIDVSLQQCLRRYANIWAPNVTGEEKFFGPNPAEDRTRDSPHKNPTLYRVAIKAGLYRKAVQVFIYIYPVTLQISQPATYCVTDLPRPNQANVSLTLCLARWPADGRSWFHWAANSQRLLEITSFLSPEITSFWHSVPSIRTNCSLFSQYDLAAGLATNSLPSPGVTSPLTNPR